MALRFVGRHEHSLDVKGRIILPARYRANFDTLAYLSKNTERCLALWTPDAFERKLDQMEAKFDGSTQDRAMARAWASGSTDVELDRQGRVAIPGYLREYARLESAVLIHGAITHIEFWDPDEWAVWGESGDAELADPALSIGSTVTPAPSSSSPPNGV